MYRSSERNCAEKSINYDHENNGNNLVLNIGLREIVKMLANMTQRDDDCY